MGFKEESLIQELHEIPIEYLWSAYIEEPPTWVSKWIFIIGLSYSAAFFHFIGTVNRNDRIDETLILLLLAIALNVYFYKKNKGILKKYRYALKVTSYINGKQTLYSIFFENSTDYMDKMNATLDKINQAKSDFRAKEKGIKDAEEVKRKKIELNKIKDSFKDLLKVNSANQIDIPNTDTFSKHLETHQQEIAKFNQRWIHDLVKIKSYLQSANISIKSNFQQTIEEDDLEYFEQMQSEVINQVQAYDKVYGNALILIDSIIESNHVLSYEIYEIFDKLGFFESNWEQRLIQKFDDLSDSINETNANINSINEKFDLITNTSISKMVKEAGTPNLIKTGMPLLSMYGGYKLGYHMFGPSKNNSN